MLCDVETPLIESRPGDDLECELDDLKEERSAMATAEVSPFDAALADT